MYENLPFALVVLKTSSSFASFLTIIRIAHGYGIVTDDFGRMVHSCLYSSLSLQNENSCLFLGFQKYNSQSKFLVSDTLFFP